MIPRGSSPDEVKAYYEWLMQNHLSTINMGRATNILTSGPFLIFLWGFILIGFFFLYSRFLQSVHRKKGELYGAASFAGSILERIGPLSIFTWIITIAVFLWGLYFLIMQTIQGQIY